MHGGACVAGGRAWQGACMARGCVAGACVAGGCMAGGHAWQGACMVGGMCGGEGNACGRRDCHCSGRYVSFWNAFLLLPPSNEVCEGYVFTSVPQSFCSQEACVVAGWRAWLQGGMHGFGGHVWLPGVCMFVGGA